MESPQLQAFGPDTPMSFQDQIVRDTPKIDQSYDNFNLQSHDDLRTSNIEYSTSGIPIINDSSRILPKILSEDFSSKPVSKKRQEAEQQQNEKSMTQRIRDLQFPLNFATTNIPQSFNNKKVAPQFPTLQKGMKKTQILMPQIPSINDTALGFPEEPLSYIEKMRMIRKETQKTFFKTKIHPKRKPALSALQQQIEAAQQMQTQYSPDSQYPPNLQELMQSDANALQVVPLTNRSQKRVQQSTNSSQQNTTRSTSPKKSQDAFQSQTLVPYELNKDLIIQYSSIEDPTDDKQVSEITEIIISEKKLSRVNQSDMKSYFEQSILYADLSGNRLAMDDLYTLKTLRSLVLVCNSIKTINLPAESFQNLEELDLSNNSITGSNALYVFLQLSKLPKLRFLDLSGNKLNQLPVDLSNLQTLTRLFLMNCGLFDENSVFEGLNSIPNLEYVNLGHNALQRIPLLKTLKLTKLKELHLHYNKISYFEDLFPLVEFNSLENLTLYGNEIVKNSKDIKTFLNQISSNLKLYSNVVTDDPENVLKSKKTSKLKRKGNEISQFYSNFVMNNELRTIEYYEKMYNNQMKEKQLLRQEREPKNPENLDIYENNDSANGFFITQNPDNEEETSNFEDFNSKDANNQEKEKISTAEHLKSFEKLPISKMFARPSSDFGRTRQKQLNNPKYVERMKKNLSNLYSLGLNSTQLSQLHSNNSNTSQQNNSPLSKMSGNQGNIGSEIGGLSARTGADYENDWFQLESLLKAENGVGDEDESGGGVLNFDENDKELNEKFEFTANSANSNNQKTSKRLDYKNLKKVLNSKLTIPEI